MEKTLSCVIKNDKKELFVLFFHLLFQVGIVAINVIGEVIRKPTDAADVSFICNFERIFPDFKYARKYESA